eukprot:scaffold257351_cov37-Prasinocladus_malaysianus.AAC.1
MCFSSYSAQVLSGIDRRIVCSSGWHCDTVEISNINTGEHAFFRCLLRMAPGEMCQIYSAVICHRAQRIKSWFDKKEGDGQIEREYVLRAADTPPSSLIQYELVFKTADVRGAGTDADVSVTMIGSVGSFGPYQLPAGAEHFERGRKDTFVIETTDIGRLEQLEVTHNGKGLGPAWMLESVEAVNKSTGKFVPTCATEGEY